MINLPANFVIVESPESEFILKVTWTDVCNCERQALFPSGKTRGQAELAMTLMKVLVQDSYATGFSDASNEAFFRL